MLFLFDVDGTLTPPRLKICDDMILFLNDMKKKGIHLGIVGGSDYAKIEEQVSKEVLLLFDHVFSENGMVLHRQGQIVHSQNMKKRYSQAMINAFISAVLLYIGDLDIPVKTGTFVEFRKGMINISPIGRNCSQEERDDFEKYDQIHKVREKMIQYLEENFSHMCFDYSIGGQISFDVFPRNFNKTFCLNYLPHNEPIHFFGDKTDVGGNDFEIYEDGRVIGHKVETYKDTIILGNMLYKMYFTDFS